MELKTVSLINGIIQTILCILLVVDLIEYLDMGIGSYESDYKNYGLIFCIAAILLIVVIPYFVTKRVVNRAEESGDYSILRHNAISDIITNALEIAFFAIVSEEIVFEFLTERISMDYFEGIYFTGMYVVVKKYAIIMAVVSLVVAIINCALVKSCEAEANYRRQQEYNRSNNYYGNDNYYGNQNNYGNSDNNNKRFY